MKRKFLILREPEPTGGGAAPPAASAVINSDVSEKDAAEIVRLKREADELRKGKKDVETRVAELEDENRQLKTIPKPPEPPAIPPKKSWLDGATFFQ